MGYLDIIGMIAATAVATILVMIAIAFGVLIYKTVRDL